MSVRYWPEGVPMGAIVASSLESGFSALLSKEDEYGFVTPDGPATMDSNRCLIHSRGKVLDSIHGQGIVRYL